MRSKQETRSETVEVSVIIASLYSESALENCLKSVLADRRDSIEVIVADCCLKEKTAEWTNKFPNISFIEFPPKTSLPVLLAAGIARSEGKIIAITDSTCVVADDWITSILRAHQTEKSPVIGGAIEMLDEDASLTDWAAYFCDYGQFMQPLKRGVVGVIPGNNFSLKRPILTKGAEFVDNEFWKTQWCRKLQSEGVELFSEPAISAHIRKTYKLIPFLIRRFHHGRCFAGMHVEKVKITQRALYAAGTILLPFIFLFRTISPVIRKKRFTKQLLLSLPIIISAIVSWSVGETVGYLAGTGNSCKYIN